MKDKNETNKTSTEENPEKDMINLFEKYELTDFEEKLNEVFEYLDM